MSPQPGISLAGLPFTAIYIFDPVIADQQSYNSSYSHVYGGMFYGGHSPVLSASLTHLLHFDLLSD
jgi:hypothetical protein